MNRLAVILNSPLSKGHKNHLVFLHKNVELQLAFLKSANGGAWKENEIVLISNPTTEQIQKIRRLCSKMDLVKLFFSGHGGELEGQDFIQINDRENIWVTSLFTNAKRQISIIEACRKEVPKWHYDYGGISGAKPEFNRSNLKLARQLYEAYVNDSPHGHVVFYSGSPGELSWVSNEGGNYTNSLLQAVQKWNSKRNSDVLTAGDAFYGSTVQLRKKSTEQNPTYSSSNEEALTIPFAVNPDVCYLSSVDVGSPRRTESSLGAILTVFATVGIVTLAVKAITDK